MSMNNVNSLRIDNLSSKSSSNKINTKQLIQEDTSESLLKSIQMVKDCSSSTQEVLQKLLANNEYINNGSKSFLSLLHSKFYLIELNKGTTIYNEKDTANLLYFIYEGKVEIIKNKLERVVLSENSAFGEESLIKFSTRSHSAKTLTDTKLFALYESDYHDIISSYNNQILNEKLNFLKRIPYLSIFLLDNRKS